MRFRHEFDFIPQPKVHSQTRGPAPVVLNVVSKIRGVELKAGLTETLCIVIRVAPAGESRRCGADSTSSAQRASRGPVSVINNKIVDVAVGVNAAFLKQVVQNVVGS